MIPIKRIINTMRIHVPIVQDLNHLQHPVLNISKDIECFNRKKSKGCCTCKRFPLLFSNVWITKRFILFVVLNAISDSILVWVVGHELFFGINVNNLNVFSSLKVWKWTNWLHLSSPSQDHSKMVKYVVVSGGVLSGIGKGIIASYVFFSFPDS
jgi:hypothetical protein